MRRFLIFKHKNGEIKNGEVGGARYVVWETRSLQGARATTFQV